VSSGTEGDEEDSSSYTTAEDHWGSSEGSPASDDSDDTMKTSRMDTAGSRSSSSEEKGSNGEEALDSPPGQPQLPLGNAARKRRRSTTLPVEENVLRTTAGELGTTNPGERVATTVPDPDCLRTSSSPAAPARVLEDFKHLGTVTSSDLQKIFDCFKVISISNEDCVSLKLILDCRLNKNVSEESL